MINGGEGTYGDVQIKPGDDITLESHHRALDKRDEITIKTSNGQDGASKAPVKLQVIAADMTLSSKGKTEDSNVMNVNVTTGSGKGYLKVRAQAIDLRCEEHGGIALQPKGKDSQNHMNKIKFEHGGGDGLEFGTFNTEKTSIFTDEYRFNREGVWKMATRQTQASDKADVADDTTALKYVKQADDFYDVIAQDDEQCKTKDIIKTAYAMNGGKDRHTKITNKGAIEIATNPTYTITIEEAPVEPATATAVSTISAEIAKEQATATLGMLANAATESEDDIVYAINNLFGGNSLAGLSFMLFNVFNAPCLAAIAAAFREQGSAKWGFITFIFQMCVGYFIAMVVYNIGMLLTAGVFGIWTVISMLMTIVVLILLFRPIKN